MKTTFNTVATLLAMALSLACTFPALADESANSTIGEKLETYKGTITAIDQQDRTLSVKGFLFKKTFNTATDCNVSLEDKPKGSLADLHAGQKVEVGYLKEQGVKIAKRIAQKNQVFTGHITAIDRDKRTLAAEHGRFTRDFVIAQDCAVVLHNDKPGALEDLKVGHTVNVIYEPWNDSQAAHRIVQKYEKFVGTIRAIDAGAKMVRAKNLFTEKKFSLANGCKIIVDGKIDSGLDDLRIGETVEFSYEDVDGVLVANRIGSNANMPEVESTQTAQTTEQTQ